jgi:iron(III) transport system substrate-binding protein
MPTPVSTQTKLLLSLSVLSLSTLSLGVVPTTAGAATPKQGSACKTSDVGKTSGGLTCTKKGSKQIWDKKAVATTTAAPKEEPKKVEGKVVMACGAQEDWCQAMAKGFEKKTGIKTSFVRLSSGEAVARFGATKNNPEFDVWHGGPSDGYEAARTQGLLQPYVSPNAAKIAANQKDPQGHWTGVYLGVLGFCSNKSALSRLNVSAPKTWDALLDAKFKGQIGIAHPATSGTAYAALWTHVQIWGGDVDSAFDYFKRLHPNVLQYSKSGSAPSQQAGRGEVAVGIVFSHDCVKLREEGLTDLTVTFPAEGTGYEIGGLGIVKGAKNIDAAKLYVDWALTPEAQEIPATVKSFQIPTHPDAKVSDKAVKLSDVKLVNYDDTKAAASKKALVERFDAQIASTPR